MDDFKVPTVQVDVSVLDAQGVELTGVIFMPAFSAVHAGPMDAAEWINSGSAFFPFRQADDRAFVLNKRQMLVLSVAVPVADEAQEAGAELPVKHVAVVVGPHRFEGRVVIDMPLNQQRLLDYVNRAEAFLLLHGDDGRDHLIQKDRISKLHEI